MARARNVKVSGERESRRHAYQSVSATMNESSRLIGDERCQVGTKVEAGCNQRSFSYALHAATFSGQWRVRIEVIAPYAESRVNWLEAGGARGRRGGAGGGEGNQRQMRLAVLYNKI